MNALSPFLLLGFAVAGALHILIPRETIKRHLGGKGILPIVKAALFGVPLPLCSCGVIPVAASLRKEGASRASVMSFLVSTPTTGVDSILATYSLLGPLFAIFRPVAAFLTGIGVGTLSMFWMKDEVASPSSCDCKIGKRWTLLDKLKELVRYSFFELPRDIGKWLLFGVFAGGVLSALIPSELFSRYLSNQYLAFLLMIVIAVPLYVCSMGSIPIAAALIAKGLNPGAALTFLIAGPATNTVTIAVVGKMFGKKGLFLYLTSIILMALGAGALFNLIWKALGNPPELITGGGDKLPMWISAVSSVVLLAILLNAIFHREPSEIKAGLVLKVPDMNCRHCAKTIKETLAELNGVLAVRIDLNKKLVGVEGEPDPEDVRNAIENVGYTVEGTQRKVL